MSASREELTRVAARLFAERGYQGTSLADLAEAARRAEAVALPPHRLEGRPALGGRVGRRRRLPRRPRRRAGGCGRDRADPARAARAPRRRRRPARHRDRLRARVALPRGRAPGRGSSPSAAATRSGCATSSATASSAASCAPTSTSRPPALLFLSAANWAYTWLRPGARTDELADRLYAVAARRHARVRDAAD